MLTIATLDAMRAFHNEIHGKRKVSMVSQKQIKAWIPEAIETFQSIMPLISASYPEIRIASPTTLKSIRAELVEKNGSPNRNMKEPYTSIMEILHGERGDAILIYQKYCPDTQKEFNHAIWHELGHFYAASTEEESFYHLAGQEPNENNIRQTGYFVWHEFVAECIANLITTAMLEEGWKEEYKLSKHWMLAKLRLSETLWAAYEAYPNSFSEYDLAFYFAEALTDPETVVFRHGAVKKELKMWNYTKQEYDPYDSQDLDSLAIGHYQLYDYCELIIDAFNLLQRKICEEEFWKVDGAFLDKLGTIITDMNNKKAIANARKMIMDAGFFKNEKGDSTFMG